MKIACFSDLHGIIPDPVECDLALVAGDLCPEGSWQHQLGFLQGPFNTWLKNFKHVLFVAGNHDHFMATNPEMIPRFHHNSRYLCDTSWTPTNHHMMHGWDFHGKPFRVHGMPWSLSFGRYSFMCDESEMATRLKPSQGADILLIHGPPHGYGDRAPRRDNNGNITHYENAGSWALREHIDTYRPKLVVCGHIHESYGVYQCGSTTIVNAAVVEFAQDEYSRLRKRIAHPAIVVEIDN